MIALADPGRSSLTSFDATPRCGRGTSAPKVSIQLRRILAQYGAVDVPPVGVEPFAIATALLRPNLGDPGSTRTAGISLGSGMPPSLIGEKQRSRETKKGDQW
ncbi:Gag-Pol polyprotein [Rhodococcus sp. AW25M09]|nr:Gag-Pol polyprotein [Rhodococcus sp. AW25M09]